MLRCLYHSRFSLLSFRQQALALGGEKVDLVQHDLDIFALLGQLRAPPLQPFPD